MTALSEAMEMLLTRQSAVASAYELASNDDQREYIAGEALLLAGIDPASASLTPAQAPLVALALDVAVWRWVESRAALLFDFSADGGSYQRSQLLKAAAEMRRLAEARAVGLLRGLAPEVTFDVLYW